MWFALDSCARRRLVLEPNAHFAEPIEYDMSGIRFRAEGSDLRTFRVYQVLKESPAAEAGLRVGDVLAAIDGVPASKFSLDEVYKMLKQQEREYKLDVRRGSETFFVKLKMKRII
jgi:C-terminal processing protease CtpA/Prc